MLLTLRVVFVLYFKTQRRCGFRSDEARFNKSEQFIERSPQDRRDGGSESRQIFTDNPVPLLDLLAKIQANSRRNAPWRFQRPGRALDP